MLGSVPGKGYFVKNTEVGQQLKIFLLFNKLSAHKKIIYDAFVASLGEMASVDFYIYNNDFDFFKRLINNKKATIRTMSLCHISWMAVKMRMS